MATKVYKDFYEWWLEFEKRWRASEVEGGVRNYCLEAWDAAVNGTWANADEDKIKLQAEVERLQAALNAVAEKAYQSDVLETGMKEHWIGEGKEYADKADWINDWLCQFFEM